ncbi:MULTISPECIES: recombinase RecT [Shewanella]|uniref:recombinase RecT n=1 Tax=Shewanella TaxID=22 RepID=UPI000B348EA4|nr:MULTISPECIES: recombinase RecT [Shewanella]AYV11392.1 hypothetical protein EEY24_00010 [Shewanella algae]QXN27523.1 recombinase RecT [Shewanella putrefaciens]
MAIPFQEIYQRNFDYLLTQQADKSIDLNEEIGFLTHLIVSSMDSYQPMVNAAAWSVREVLVTLCRLGLSLDPAKKLAYVMMAGVETAEPYLKLHPGYRGEIAIATKFGVIQNATATLVYEQDHFRLQPSTNEVEHFVTSLSIDPAVRGLCTGGYCRSVLTNGSIHYSYMSIEELDAIAQNQIEMTMGNTPWNGIWLTEMRRIALYRRASKDWRQMMKSTLMDTTLQALAAVA